MFGLKPKVVEPMFAYTLLMTDGNTIVVVAESLPWTHPSLFNRIVEIISVRNAS